MVNDAGRGFCAGIDIAELSGKSAMEHREWVERMEKPLMAVSQIKKPVIAQAHGVAAANGLGRKTGRPGGRSNKKGLKAVGFFRGLSGGLWERMPMPLLPESVKGNCILHVSDTPSSFYNDLKRLLAFLRPEALVHTGDIADDVKLEIQPSDRPRFRKNLLRFFGACSPIPESRVFIACGNHDDCTMVKDLAGEMVVFQQCGRMNLCGIDTAVGHYLSNLTASGVRLNLYGHDDSLPPADQKDRVFLNGILGIGVIEIEPFRVHVVPYPPYVDRDRMFRIRAGF